MRLRKKQVRDRIKDSIIESIRRKMSEAFIRSQAICPVVTGNLKSSGIISDIENGAQLRYTAEYASNVERDFPGGRVTIASYQRKSGVRVKGYSYYAPPTKGQRFIEKSIKESFSKLNSEVDMKLRIHFRSVTKV